MDGFDVLMALRDSGESETLRSKIVAVSALAEPRLVEELARLGVHRTLMKPLHISEVIDLVEEAAPPATAGLVAAEV
jgi:CheY-like chemotaxis protein